MVVAWMLLQMEGSGPGKPGAAAGPSLGPEGSHTSPQMRQKSPTDAPKKCGHKIILSHQKWMFFGKEWECDYGSVPMDVLKTGTDIVQWLMKNLSIEDPGKPYQKNNNKTLAIEAIHLGSLIAAQGYIFPISDHVLTMKDDGTFYRFQVGLRLLLLQNLFFSSSSNLRLELPKKTEARLSGLSCVENRRELGCGASMKETGTEPVTGGVLPGGRGGQTLAPGQGKASTGILSPDTHALLQAPYFWPSNCWEPENTDYAIYLCKRTMQNKARLELADYEAVSMIIFRERIFLPNQTLHGSQTIWEIGQIFTCLPEEALLSQDMTEGPQPGGGATLDAVKKPCPDNPALTAPSDPPTSQMSPPAFAASVFQNTPSDLVTLRDLCPSQSTQQSHHSPLIPLASQDP
ncbi:hypothetical protein HPG69_013213 [Diceros bicornis minor]|uniref:DEP domain-containing protein n=1 Tax=Diceros bicornis minor TaxID=77932 RepID=A0A7J7F4S2_DICBM|nr:hypothetical protein HPG69_013213 [Diceros bicornis minor]